MATVGFCRKAEGKPLPRRSSRVWGFRRQTISMCSAIQPLPGDVGAMRSREALLTQQGGCLRSLIRNSMISRVSESGRCTSRCCKPWKHPASPGARPVRPQSAGRGPRVFPPLSISAKTGSANASHDAHVYHDVGRVGKLDADLRHGGSDGAHREGSTYMVRPRMEPRKAAEPSAQTNHFKLLVGPALSFGVVSK